jgi:FAD/FMN-containing dehydrogenase
MYIELPVPDPVAFGENWMAWYEAPYREVMTTLIQDFGGRAHLGKNKDWVFEFETEQDAYGENLLRFQAAVSELDPTGVFSNDWSFALGLSR